MEDHIFMQYMGFKYKIDAESALTNQLLNDTLIKIL